MSKLIEFTNLLRNKKNLIACIFITLFIQITISFFTMIIEQKYKYLNNIITINNKLPFTILSVVLAIILIMIMSMSNLPFFIKQIIFILFSIINGFLLSLLIHSINDPDVVKSAAIATVINFIMLFILGLIIVFLGYDLGWLGLVLFISLIIVIVLQIFRILSKNSKKMNKIVAIIIVILFSLFILYDTNNILLKYKNNDTGCIEGALDYYLDIFNLFSSWININN